MRDVSRGSRANRDGGQRGTASTFAATDYTPEWIKRHCQIDSNHAPVAGIDMTYKLGHFYLTTVTLFVYKSNKNKHPTTLAAVMTLVSKEKRDECLAWKSEGIEWRVCPRKWFCKCVPHSKHH